MSCKVIQCNKRLASNNLTSFFTSASSVCFFSLRLCLIQKPESLKPDSWNVFVRPASSVAEDTIQACISVTRLYTPDCW